MQKSFLKTLPALALTLLGLGATANDIEPGKEFYTVIRAPKPIVLDGSLSEWGGVTVLADPKFSVPKGSGAGANPKYVLFEEYSGGTWSGPDDQTSAVQIAYDADNVYFGFVVTDDTHENAANSAWNGDSIQLMIASGDRTSQVALYNYALGGVDGTIGDIIVNHEAGPGGSEECACATEAVVTRNAVTKRTTYEIKLPKAALGLTNLLDGPQFGLGMAINDGDTSPGQTGQKGWGGLGAHALVFGKSPSETALITLAKANDIEPGKEYYTATTSPKPIVLDGALAEWSGVPVLADPKFSIPKGSGATGTGKYVLFEEYSGGTWSGPDDQTSAVQVAYDADNVYFGFVVTDDTHENAANSAWNGDSIQLMIASADRSTQVALYNYALGGVDGTIGDIIVNHEAGPGGNADCNCATEAIVTRNATTKKTTYEIKLPAGALGLTAPLTVGTKFGLGMAINDGDTSPGQAGQKGWGGLGAHALVFGKSPSETAEVTLGTAAAGTDLVFLSAINPSIVTFSFRANDKGASILSPTNSKLTIDGKAVTLVAGTKSGDATDFTYTQATPFTPGTHTYLIQVKDTLGNTITDSGSFVAAAVATLTTAQQAVSVDKTKPGFIWSVFQNEGATGTTLADAELALAGLVKDEGGTLLTNLADPAATGVATAAGTVSGKLVKFEIPTVINLSQEGGTELGTFVPDDQMPGVPGASGANDGIAAEIVSFIELPAGVVSLGVSSDDGFRAQAGYIGKLADAALLGEQTGVGGSTFKFFVQNAGIYPVRAVYQEVGGNAHVEFFSLNANGDKVLVNDVANGGFKAYRTGVAPVKSTVFSAAITSTDGQLKISWTEPGVVLQESTSLTGWTDLPAATSPYTSVPGTRGNVYYRLRK